MQANEFEKKIQDKLDGFGLVPGAEVWTHVAARIDAEKKRRRLLFVWFFAGLLLAGGAAGWWLTGTKSTVAYNTTSPKASNNRPDEMLAGNKKATVIKNSIIKNELQDKQNLAADKKRKIEVFRKNNLKERDDKTDLLQLGSNKTLVKKEPEGTENIGKDDDAKPVVTEPNILKSSVAKAAGIPLESKNAPPIERTDSSFENAQQTTVVPGAETKLQDVAKAELNPATTPEKNIVTTSDTSSLGAVNKPMQPVKKPYNKKWSFGLTALAGFSDNVSGFPVISNEKSLAYDLPVTSTSGGTNPSISPLRFSKGFSFALGLYTSRQLTKTIELSVGVNYHHYIAKSTTGATSFTQRSFFDSLLSQFVNVVTSYSPGQSQTYSNSYKTIEFPVNLLFRINKNEAKPFLVSAGIAPGYLTGSNALYANRSANIYYIDQQQFHRFQLSLQAGFFYAFAGSAKYLLSAGPVIQYGCINLSKFSSDAGQHLFFTGLKTTISFK